MSASLFISDLHLDDSRPQTLLLFKQFLQTTATQAASLYILGDLFDAWVGDDDDSRTAGQVIAALKQLTSSGTSVFIMHGNRDFLISEHFAGMTGATLLEDPHVIEINQQPLLLTHGDQLCSADIAYQQARQMRLDPLWLQTFADKTLSERKKIAADYRKQSGEAKSLLPADIMDVTVATAEQWFSDYNVELIIHGHTHRPADHLHQVQGKTCKRIVLDQWHCDYGMYLSIDDKLNIQRRRTD